MARTATGDGDAKILEAQGLAALAAARGRQLDWGSSKYGPVELTAQQP
ncbi:hypothetical protein [Kitasatospora sp. CB01950]|nr:hypothetical protein [Kitasatospora sp. CB01950]